MDDLDYALLNERIDATNARIDDVNKWHDYQARKVPPEGIIKRERAVVLAAYKRAKRSWRLGIVIFLLSFPIAYFSFWLLKTTPGGPSNASQGRFVGALAGGGLAVTFFILGGAWALKFPRYQKSYCWKLAEKMKRRMPPKKTAENSKEEIVPAPADGRFQCPECGESIAIAAKFCRFCDCIISEKDRPVPAKDIEKPKPKPKFLRFKR